MNILYKVLCLLTLVNLAATQGKTGRSCCLECDGDAEVVCDSNGDQYEKKCQFDCIADYYSKFGQELNQSECGNEVNPSTVIGVHDFAECAADCACQPQGDTCAANDMKLPNECYFNCIRKYYVFHSNDEHALDQVECVSTHQQTPSCEVCCACPGNIDTVCTADGKTYDNICAFDCAYWYHQTLNKNIKRVACPKSESGKKDEMQFQDFDLKVFGTRNLTIYQIG